MIRVDYDSVSYLAAVLRGCADTTTTGVPSAREYKRLFAELPVYSNDGVVYLSIHSTATKVEAALDQWIADLERSLSGGADCTDAAIIALRSADAATVQAFSGRYTEADVQTGRSTGGDAARACLGTPEAQTEFATVFAAMGWVGNWISPSFWLGSLADAVLDLLAGQGVHDPFEYIGDQLAGNWEVVSRTSDALTHLSAYFQAVADQVTTTWTNVSPDWSGETATAAGSALATFSGSVSEVSSALTNVSSEYNSVAVGVYQTADMITTLLRELCDAAIVAVLAAAGGTALIETGIGAIAGYAVAAAKVVEVIATLAEISDWLSTAMDLAFAFIGQVTLWLGPIHGVPDVAIQNPRF